MTGGYREFYDRMQTIAMGDVDTSPIIWPTYADPDEEWAHKPVIDRSELEVPYATIPCRIIRQGDENYCSTCGVRWDVGEPKPECRR